MDYTRMNLRVSHKNRLLVSPAALASRGGLEMTICQRRRDQVTRLVWNQPGWLLGPTVLPVPSDMDESGPNAVPHTSRAPEWEHTMALSFTVLTPVCVFLSRVKVLESKSTTMLYLSKCPLPTIRLTLEICPSKWDTLRFKGNWTCWTNTGTLAEQKAYQDPSRHGSVPGTAFSTLPTYALFRLILTAPGGDRHYRCHFTEEPTKEQKGHETLGPHN